MNTPFTKTLLLFCGEMVEMILITGAFILLGTKAVSINALIFLLIVLAILVYQFIYFRRNHDKGE